MVIYTISPKRLKAKTWPSAGKIMAILFGDVQDLIVIDSLTEKSTIDALITNFRSESVKPLLDGGTLRNGGMGDEKFAWLWKKFNYFLKK